MYLKVLRRYHDLFPNDPLNVLISLAYNEGEREGFLFTYKEMLGELIFDSGAWSVAQGTSNFTLTQVITFLQHYGDNCNYYFSFDNDFSDRGFANNIDNQIVMERAGLHPVPVIHNFCTEEIEYYVNSGKYTRLALGSSQSTNFDDIRYAVDKIKKWGNPDIRIHWFGGAKFDWLVRLPIASCDTTSWAAMGAYGNIRYWNPHVEKLNKTHSIYVGGQIKKFKEGEYHFVDYPWRGELEEYLEKTFHMTYADLLGYDDKLNMQLINARFGADLEKRINEERIKMGVELE